MRRNNYLALLALLSSLSLSACGANQVDNTMNLLYQLMARMNLLMVMILLSLDSYLKI